MMSEHQVFLEIKEELKRLNTARSGDKKDVRELQREQQYREELDEVIAFILLAVMILAWAVYLLAKEVGRLKLMIADSSRSKPRERQIIIGKIDRARRSQELADDAEADLLDALGQLRDRRILCHADLCYGMN
jgi:hypothetical protein